MAAGVRRSDINCVSRDLPEACVCVCGVGVCVCVVWVWVCAVISSVPNMSHFSPSTGTVVASEGLVSLITVWRESPYNKEYVCGGSRKSYCNKVRVYVHGVCVCVWGGGGQQDSS